MSYHTFRLSWPVKALRPNGGRAHHFEYARAAKAAKAEAGTACMASGLRRNTKRAFVHVTWHPNAKGRAPDLDNCIASFKAHQDGIAAAVGLDDGDTANFQVAHEISAERRACMIVRVSTDDSFDVPLVGDVE